MTPPPVAVGLLVSEQVIVDRTTGLPTAVNVYGGLTADGFPSAQRFAVFARLTNGRGRAVARVVVTVLETEGVAVGGEYPLQFIDPLATVNFIRNIRIRFPAEGWYEVALRVDDDVVAQQRLHVRQRPSPEERQE